MSKPWSFNFKPKLIKIQSYHMIHMKAFHWMERTKQQIKWPIQIQMNMNALIWVFPEQNTGIDINKISIETYAKKLQMKSVCLPHMRVAFRLWFLEWILGWSRITLQIATGCCFSWRRCPCLCSTNIRQIHLVLIISILLFAMTYTLTFRTRWADCFTRSRFHEVIILVPCHPAGRLWRNEFSHVFGVCAQMRMNILFGQHSQCFRCWFAITLFRCDTLQMNEKKKWHPANETTMYSDRKKIKLEPAKKNLLNNVTTFDDADVFLSWNNGTD